MRWRTRRRWSGGRSVCGAHHEVNSESVFFQVLRYSQFVLEHFALEDESLAFDRSIEDCSNASLELRDRSLGNAYICTDSEAMGFASGTFDVERSRRSFHIII